MQTVKYNKFMKFNFEPLYSMINIYNSASDKYFSNNLKQYKINRIFDNLIDLYSNRGFKLTEKPDVNYITNSKTYKVEETNKLLLLFSGGKDSTAAAMKYKDMGYDVVLYFLQGVNISYSDEQIKAERVAKLLGLPLIVETVKIEGKGGFLENPTKDQLLLAFALNYGIPNNISKYSYGGFSEDTIETSAFDRNFSDSVEAFEEFEKSVKKIFPQFEIHVPFKNEISTLKLIGEHKELWNEFQSCLMPLRFRDFRKKSNEEKYNIKLLNNRCGSCWKCCMEYIVWADLGLVEYNKEFYIHCLELLKDKTPEERPYAKNIKTMVDVYDLWIDNKELFKNSKYFSELGLNSGSTAVENRPVDNKVNKEELRFTLNFASEEDLEEICSLWKENKETLGYFVKAQLLEAIEDERLFVVRDKKQPGLVGFCGITFKKRNPVVFLDSICVNKNYRKMGIGRALLNKLKEYGKNIELDCFEGAENNAFYDKVAVLDSRRYMISEDRYWRRYKILVKGEEKIKLINS